MGVKEVVAKLDKKSKSGLSGVKVGSRVKFEFHLSTEKKAEDSPLLVGDTIIREGQTFAVDRTYKHFVGKCFRKPNNTLVFLTKEAVETAVETLFVRKINMAYGHKGAVVFAKKDNPDTDDDSTTTTTPAAPPASTQSGPTQTSSTPPTPSGGSSEAAPASEPTPPPNPLADQPPPLIKPDSPDKVKYRTRSAEMMRQLQRVTKIKDPRTKEISGLAAFAGEQAARSEYAKANQTLDMLFPMIDNLLMSATERIAGTPEEIATLTERAKTIKVRLNGQEIGVGEAFKAAKLDEHFEPWTTDMSEYRPGQVDDHSKATPEFKAMKQAAGQIISLDRELRRKGADWKDIAKVWETVPPNLRPDDVVEDLRAYYLAQKALNEESEESKAESRQRAREADKSMIRSAIGQVVEIAGISLESADAANSVPGITLGPDLLQQLKEIGQLVEAVGADEQAIEDTYQRISKDWKLLDAESTPKDPKTHDPTVLLSKQIFSTEEKAAKIIQHAQVFVKQAMIVVRALAPSDPNTTAILQIIDSVQDMLSFAQNALVRTARLQTNKKLKDVAADQDRGGVYDDIIAPIRGMVKQQAEKATVEATGDALKATGKIVGGAGSLAKEPITTLTGKVVKVVGTVVKVGSLIHYYKVNTARKEEVRKTLLACKNGDNDAKKRIMKESTFYAKMYLGIAGEQGDPEALKIITVLGFDEETIASQDKYVIRKALMWAGGENDTRPDEKGYIDELSDDALSGLEKVGMAIPNGAVALYEKVRGQNQSKLHDDLPKDFPAAFSTVNWLDAKKVAYKGGVKEVSTGIESKLKDYEKLATALDYRDGKKVRAACVLLDATVELFDGLNPTWVTPHPQDQKPLFFISYAIAMANQGRAKKAEHIKQFEATAKLAAGGGRVGQAETQTVSYDEFTDVSTAGLELVKKAAKKNKVVVDFGNLGDLLTESVALKKKADANDAVGITAFLTKSRESRTLLLKMKPENENFPGPDKAFQKWVDFVRSSIDSTIAAYEPKLNALYDSWKWPNPAQPTLAEFARELATAKKVGLAVDLPGSLTKAIAAVTPYVNETNKPGETADPLARMNYYDTMGQICVTALEELKKFKGKCNHKPTRNYLIDLCLRTQLWLDGANKAKKEARELWKEAVKAGNIDLGPVELTKKSWVAVKEAAYKNGLAKDHKKSGIEGALGAYESAKKLPASAEKDPNDTIKGVLVHKDLLNRINALIVTRPEWNFPALDKWLTALQQKVTLRLAELEEARLTAGRVLLSRQKAKV